MRSARYPPIFEIDRDGSTLILNMNRIDEPMLANPLRMRMLTSTVRRLASRWIPLVFVLIPFLSGCAGSGSSGEAQVFGGCHSYVFCRGGTGPPGPGECCLDEGGDR